MNFKPIPNKFAYLNWQEVEGIAKDKRSTVIWTFGAVEQHGPHLPLATHSISCQFKYSNLLGIGLKFINFNFEY